MRIFVFIVLLAFVFPSPARAQYGSADYLIERWDEDYSYLKGAPKTDFFDPIKYISIGPDPDWYLSLGGQVRERYDFFNNSSFGAGRQDDDGFRLTRVLAHVDAHLGPNLRAFVQIDASRVDDRIVGPRPGDADDIDLQQGFGDFKLSLGDASSAVIRVGRQELIYGAQRLVSPNDWANVRRTFDGAKVSFSFPNDALDVFVTRPVIIDKPHLNSEDEDAWFAGIYNVRSLPTILPGGHSKLDLYALGLGANKSASNPADSQTYTLGTRFHTTPGQWDFDVEADWQIGRMGSDNISAWAFAAEGGYTFSEIAMTPRASLGIDLASGSPDRTQRFNQLFPPQYLYLGHIYLFGRQNIIDLHPGLLLNLTRDVTLSLDEHIFWRQNVHDAVYDLNGGVVRASNGSDAASIGNEFDAAINWQIQRHFSAYIGYAHFFTGTFVEQTGPDHDVDFFYAAVTFTF
jgi:hypothetical protein